MYCVIVEEWVFFLGNIQIRNVFIVVDVYCVEDNWFVVCCQQYLLVGFKLFLFVWCVVVIYIEYFGMEQFDIFCVVGKCVWCFQSGVDICCNINMFVIMGIGQLCGSLCLLFLVFICQCLCDLIIIVYCVIWVNCQYVVLGVKYCRLFGIMGNCIQW